MISAVVLAAGLSTRMGRPKQVLPWGSSTVIGQVVSVLLHAGLEDIVVVTGRAREEVEAAVRQAERSEVRTIFNPRYAEDEMMISLQVGMACLGEHVEAMLVVLGDQPQIEVEVVRSLIEAFRAGEAALIVPSYQMHRGHPWVVARELWPALQSAPPGSTLRNFLHTFPQQITYLPVESSSILRDLDTPEDYASEKLAWEGSGRECHSRKK